MIEIDVDVKETPLEALQGSLVGEDIEQMMEDSAALDNFLPELSSAKHLIINDLYIPHGGVEVVQRSSNAVKTSTPRGNQNYSFRSKYSDTIFTLTIPLLIESKKSLEIYSTLINDLKTFGFLTLEYKYLPEIPECFGVYSLDEFRLHIDSDLNLYLLELDVQAVNMQMFGKSLFSFTEEGRDKHLGDSDNILTMSELLPTGALPNLKKKLEIGSQSFIAFAGYGKGSSEFRAFLDEGASDPPIWNTSPSYSEDRIAGAFDIDIKVPLIYPKDGAFYETRPVIEGDGTELDIFDTSEESLIEAKADYRVVRLPDNRAIPQSITTNEGVVDYDGKDITSYFEGKSEGIPEASKRTREFIVRWVEDVLFYDREVHNIKQITYKKGHRWARHFVGNSSIAMTQYIGTSPATLSIVSHYIAPDANSGYTPSEDVPRFFQQLLTHINDNATMYPSATAFNFIKIKDHGYGYIDGKYIPSEAYRLASATNSNVEVFAVNFIESSMDELYDKARFRLATEILSEEVNNSAAEVIQKYLAIAKAYFEKNDLREPATTFHSTLLNRLVRLKQRLQGELRGVLTTFDGFERTEARDYSEGMDKNGPPLPKPAPIPNAKGQVIIMGDSIAVGFWNEGLREAQRKSDRVLCTARISWTPEAIFEKGGKETTGTGVFNKDLIVHVSPKGTPLPSQSKMLDMHISSHGAPKSENVIILSSGISNNPEIKVDKLASYIIGLAKQVSHLHILGVASNGKLVDKLNKVFDKVRTQVSNVSLGPSSPASDKIHPKGTSHTGAIELIQKAGL